MTAVLRVVEEPDDRNTTREAVEELLAGSYDRWRRFELACLAGVPEVRESVLGFREALLAKGHAFGSHDEQFGEVFGALLGLAEEYLPNSPGAVRARLRKRVRDDVRPRPEGGVNIVGDVSARRVVEVVLAYEDKLFEETVVAAGYGHARIYAAARHIWDGLAAIGREYPVEAIEDELWVVVCELLPDTPAARPGTARLEEMWRRAERYVDEHGPGGDLGDEARQEHEIRALEAVHDHDPPAYRDALRDLCRAARDAARGTNGNDGDEGGGNEG